MAEQGKYCIHHRFGEQLLKSLAPFPISHRIHTLSVHYTQISFGVNLSFYIFDLEDEQNSNEPIGRSSRENVLMPIEM